MYFCLISLQAFLFAARELLPTFHGHLLGRYFLHQNIHLPFLRSSLRAITLDAFNPTSSSLFLLQEVIGVSPGQNCIILFCSLPNTLLLVLTLFTPQ
jgi:hypothetical protein